MNIKKKKKIAGGDRATDESLFSLDKTLETLPDDAELAQDATGAKP